MSRKDLTIPFDKVVQARAKREPAFAAGLLREAAECVLSGELAAARNLVRHVIKGTIGYAELSRCTGTPETSLVRMFGPQGNPTAVNLANVFMHLQKHGRFRLAVTMERGCRAARISRGRPLSTSAP